MFLILILTLTEDEDFISNTDSLIFNPGMTQSCFEILITDDANPESSEAFTIDLSFNQLPDAPTIIDTNFTVRPPYAHARGLRKRYSTVGARRRYLYRN